MPWIKAASVKMKIISQGSLLEWDIGFVDFLGLQQSLITQNFEDENLRVENNKVIEL